MCQDCIWRRRTVRNERRGTLRALCSAGGLGTVATACFCMLALGGNHTTSHGHKSTKALLKQCCCLIATICKISTATKYSSHVLPKRPSRHSWSAGHGSRTQASHVKTGKTVSLRDPSLHCHCTFQHAQSSFTPVTPASPIGRRILRPYCKSSDVFNVRKCFRTAESRPW